MTETVSPAETLAALRSQPLVYVDDLDHPALDPADHKHLARSLRVRDGDPVGLSDGQGAWRLARFGDPVDPDGPIHHTEPAPYPLAVAFAPVRAERSEVVIQRLTELGVDHVIPVFTHRSVVRWDDARSAKNHERHQRVMRESGMQSRRVWLPELSPPCGSVDQLLGGQAGDSSLSWVVADPAGDPIDHTARAVLIGPEGGFDPGETGRAQPVSLPGGILRAATAATVAAALMARHRLHSVG